MLLFLPPLVPVLINLQEKCEQIFVSDTQLASCYLNWNLVSLILYTAGKIENLELDTNYIENTGNTICQNQNGFRKSSSLIFLFGNTELLKLDSKQMLIFKKLATHSIPKSLLANVWSSCSII